MPEAIIFDYNHRLYTVYFSQKKAVLPVKLKNGNCVLVPWGRRETENSEMPLGGWARRSLLKENKNHQWNMYSPKPIQIPVLKFMEKNFEGKSCWYEITKGQCLQGLLAKEQDEYRAYILTIDPTDLMNNHYRWPHVIVTND